MFKIQWKVNNCFVCISCYIYDLCKPKSKLGKNNLKIFFCSYDGKENNKTKLS